MRPLLVLLALAAGFGLSRIDSLPLPDAGEPEPGDAARVTRVVD